jgi:putative copper resistance protein D
MSADALLAACRFLHDGALMALWGAFAYLAVLVPESLAQPVADRLTNFRLAAVSLSLATTCLTLPLQAAIIADGWMDALNVQVLGDIVASTSVGKAWLGQLLGAGLLAAVQALPPRLAPKATASASGLALATLALGGHAVMQGGWQGILHPLNDVLHVLSAGGCFGALLPLVFVLAKFDQPRFKAQAAVALRRFSSVGHWAVALAILSGIANSLFIVGWPLGWASPYQALLTTKIIIVLAMTGVAILNRYWFVPRIGGNRENALAAIRTGTLVEIGLGLAAILLVAVFGMLDPMGMD